MAPSRKVLGWPDWLPGYERRPDGDHAAQRDPPAGIVIHSGESGADLADAALRMPISYHFAWDKVPGEPGRFAQLVRLRRRAWHAGVEGNDWIGIALSGPWDQNPRQPEEREAFRRLVAELVQALPSVRYWTRHSDITRGKKDPGPGVTADWLAGLGLTWKRGPLGWGR